MAAFCAMEVGFEVLWLWSSPIALRSGSGARGIPNSPPSHGVRLGDSIDDKGVVDNFGVNGSDGVMLVLVIHHFFIDLIRDNQKIMFNGQFGYPLECLIVIKTTGWITG